MYIQALEDTEVLALSHENMQLLCKELPKTEQFFRIIMEKTYIASQKRIEYTFNFSGKEMYEKFVQSNPDFSKRIPQYILASYLGLSPEFISKIKSK